MYEIKKMYLNAGIKPIIKNTFNTLLNSEKIKEYPIFDKFKQAQIKSFIASYHGFKMIKNEPYDYKISTNMYQNQKNEIYGHGYLFDEALANLVNNLWQNLTEEERNQIKNILESEVRE